MLVDEGRLKLAEAIRFFVSNTKHCGLVKLFKLLYWLDYHHFRETGRSVTGLVYSAYPKGPVPEELHQQFKLKQGDIADQFRIQESTLKQDEYEIPTIDSEPDGSWSANRRFVPTKIKPKSRFSQHYLTEREMRIAKHLSEIFYEVTADQISDISHVRGGPWSKAIKEHGPKSTIDFMSALVPMQIGEYLEEEELIEAVRDEEETKRALS